MGSRGHPHVINKIYKYPVFNPFTFLRNFDTRQIRIYQNFIVINFLSFL